MIDIRLSDNLELMAEIQDNTVDLIYCDILYGTGRKFKDYQDLKPKREVIEEHYIPRIKEMHRILKNTGSVYLQMDYKISHWLRCILDDIFGYENMINQIIWNYQRWANSTKNFTRQNDHILFYSKSKKYTFNNLYEPFSDKSKHKGKRYSEWENGSLKTKKYVNNERLKNMSDVWNISYLNPMSKEKNGYNTQKPKELIERIIKASSNKGDLVADFYSGSFTTAEVCKDLNSNFIGCDISEKAVQIGRARVNSFAQE